MIIIKRCTHACDCLSSEGIFLQKKMQIIPLLQTLPYRVTAIAGARCEASFACQFAISAIFCPILFAAFVPNGGAFNRDHSKENDSLPLSLSFSVSHSFGRRRSFAAITAAVPVEK